MDQKLDGEGMSEANYKRKVYLDLSKFRGIFDPFPNILKENSKFRNNPRKQVIRSLHIYLLKEKIHVNLETIPINISFSKKNKINHI